MSSPSTRTAPAACLSRTITTTAPRAGRRRFEEALDHLAGPLSQASNSTSTSSLPGYELRVLAALRERGLVERTLISGMFPAGLALIREAEPSLRLGWSVPRVRRDYTTDMLTAIPALAILTGYRAMLPRRARAALREGRFDAIMAHWRVVTPALCGRCARAAESSMCGRSTTPA